MDEANGVASDGTESAGDLAELRRLVWSADTDDLARRAVAGAVAGAAAEVPDELAAALNDAVFADPPLEKRAALQRLRAVAAALGKAEAFAAAEAVWRRTPDFGLAPGNAAQQVFLAQNADGRLAEAIATAGTLVTLEDLRPRTRRHIGEAVTRFVTEGGAAREVHKQLGTRFAAAAFEGGPHDATAYADGLVAAVERRPDPDREALLLAAGLSRAAPATAGRLLARIRPEARTGLTDAIEAELGDDPDAIGCGLDRLAAERERRPRDLPTLILWASLAAAAEHPSLASAAAAVASRPAAIRTLWVAAFDLGLAPRFGPALLRALAAAGIDRLALLDIAFATGVRLDAAAIAAAEAELERDPSPQRGERITGLLLAMLAAEGVSAPAAAAFARRHAAAIGTGYRGAGATGRALFAVGDWTGALEAWDACLRAAPGTLWAVGQAAMSAMRIGDEARARAYLATVDPDAAVPGSGFAILAHAALLAGEFAFAARLLDRLADEDAPEDRYNLVGRLRAVLSGDPTRLARGTPDEAPCPAPSARPAALVIDPGFAQNSGHHLSYNAFAIDFFAAELGVPRTDVWVCTRRALAEAPVEPIDDPAVAASVFRTFDYNPYFFDDFPKTPRIFDNLARVWRSDLERGLAGVDLSGVRAIFVHSAKANLVAGLAQWIVDTFGDQPLCVAIGVIEVDYLAEGEAARAAVGAAYAGALALLAGRANIRTIVSAETAAGCAHLGSADGGLPVHHIPYLAAALAGPASAAPLALSRDTVTVGLVGGSRAERGLDLFPAAIEGLADAAGLRWIVQLERAAAEHMDERFPRILDEAVARGACTWITDRLGGDDYYAALRAMDVVLMPYRGRYAVSGSGVFYEAMQLERYLIVPAATSMREVVDEFGYPATILAEPTLDEAVAAIEGVLANRAELAERMRALRASAAVATPLERFRALVEEALAGLPRG